MADCDGRGDDAVQKVVIWITRACNTAPLDPPLENLALMPR